MIIEHLTNEQMQMYVDKALSEEARASVERHVSECAKCQTLTAELRVLDEALRESPAERLDVSFTRNVLDALNIVPRTPFLFRVVEYLAYVFGLMIVLGVMVAAFLITGVIKAEQVTKAQSLFDGASNAFGEQVRVFASGLADAAVHFAPFVFGNGNLKIVLMGIAVIGMLGLLDKVLKQRYHME